MFSRHGSGSTPQDPSRPPFAAPDLAHWPMPNGSLRHSRVAVVGLGLENRPLVRFLLREEAFVTAFDRKERSQMEPFAAAVQRQGVELHLGGDHMRHLAAGHYDLVVLTPGMVEHQPEIQSAVGPQVPVVGQMNLFFAACRAPIIGITGTSGKSTTTSLIGSILRQHGERPTYVGGNIGRVLIEEVRAIPARAWVVLEMSSFQLALLDRSPYLAVFLNIRPNHLDVHGSMEAYRSAKTNILRHQKAGDLVVLNADDPAVRSSAGLTPAGPNWFGLDKQAASAAAGDSIFATVEDGWAVIRQGNSRRPVMPTAELPLAGRHNLANVLAAVAATHLLGVPAQTIRSAVQAFPPLRHRLEVVAERGGVRFVNGSAATTPDRTVASLACLDRPAILICGGYDKGIPFVELGEAIVRRRLRALVLMGETSGQIEAAVATASRRFGLPIPPLHRVAGLEQAVADAHRLAQPGDVVLLSPGSASYGLFASFEERGLRFRQAVAGLDPGPSQRGP